jgi:hypothetical protein
MSRRVTFTLLGIIACFAPNCRSSKKKADRLAPEWAALVDESPSAQVGSYYKVKGNFTRFYPNVPTFTETPLADKYLGRGHVIQLLHPNAMDGWARVKNEDLEIGYVRFEAINIVAAEDQPRPHRRKVDEELDRAMGLKR